MKYLYWLGVALVVAIGLYISSKVEYQPLSQSLIPFIQVEQPEELGALIAQKLQDELKNAPLVLLGVMPDQIEDIELWQGFLRSLESSELQYNILIVDPELPFVELLQSDMQLNIKEEMPRFADGIKKALEQGDRVAVITPTIFSTQLLALNPAAKLKQEHGLSFTSLSVSKFPLTRQQEEQFDPPCTLEPGKDPAGTGPLGCMVFEVARRTYREIFEKDKFSGLVDKTRENDYLILLNRNPMSR